MMSLRMGSSFSSSVTHQPRGTCEVARAPRRLSAVGVFNFIYDNFIYCHAETADAELRCGIMKERQLNVFAEASLDANIKLALSRDLERLYCSLVAEPIPPHLRSFIDCLGRALDQGRHRQ
jgi:hypothetical protein